VEISFDPRKNARNIERRGLSFEQAEAFEFATAWILVDDRKDYGEIRYRTIGFLSERLHALVFTETQGGIRVISFRKANQREERLYEREKANPGND
jgi:uncharacterized protein